MGSTAPAALGSTRLMPIVCGTSLGYSISRMCGCPGSLMGSGYASQLTFGEAPPGPSWIIGPNFGCSHVAESPLPNGPLRSPGTRGIAPRRSHHRELAGLISTTFVGVARCAAAAGRFSTTTNCTRRSASNVFFSRNCRRRADCTAAIERSYTPSASGTTIDTEVDVPSSPAS